MQVLPETLEYSGSRRHGSARAEAKGSTFVLPCGGSVLIRPPRFTDEDTPMRPPGNLQELCLRDLFRLFKH